MNKEQERLLAMRRENRLSEQDYQMLTEALNKKSLCTELENSLLFNPFRKIAGFKALFLGFILIVIMSFIGVYADIYYDGTFGFFIASGIKTETHPNFLLLLYQNVIACLPISILFILAALFFRQKNIRFIDFFGTVILARFPMAFSVLGILLEMKLKPEFFNMSQKPELHFSMLSSLINLLMFGCLAWHIATCFAALKESSGLQGKKLWLSFIVSALLSEIITINLTRLFLYS